MKKEIQSIILLCLSLFLLLLVLPMIEPFYELFFSADHFYFPAFYQDIWNRPHEISKWNLPPAPTFFPDGIIYLISLFLSLGNTIASIHIYAVIYTFLLCIFSIRTLQELQDLEVWRIRIIFLFCFAILLLFVILNQNNLLLLPLFITGHHGGSLLLAIALLAFVLDKNFVINYKSVIPITILLIFARWNDGIFLTVFMVPFLVTVLLLSIFSAHLRKYSLLPTLIIAVLCILIHPSKTFLINKFLSISVYQPEKLIWNGLKDKGIPKDLFWNDAISFIKTLPFYESGILLLGLTILMLSIIRSLYILLSESRNLTKQQDADRLVFKNIFFLVFIFLSVISQLVSILLIQYTFSKDLLYAYRYYGPIFFLLFLMIPYSCMVLFSAFRGKNKIHALLGISLGVLLFISMNILIPPFYNSKLKIYSNPILNCIQTHPELQYLLKGSFGVADYWLAKPVTVLSDNLIQIQAINNMQAYEWVGRNRILQDGDKFQFAILGEGSRILESSFLEKYREPSERIFCSKFVFFLYKDERSF